MAKLALRINGGQREVETDDPDTPLLYVLRGDLGLTGTKFGCGLAQCGYCTAGMVMSARALLADTPRPTEQQVREALAGNLCRCGSHARVIRAVLRAAASTGGGR